MKKLLALSMSLAMAASLAVPAFAAGEQKYGNDTGYAMTSDPTVVVGGVTAAPTIKVIVPSVSGAQFLLNPYKIAYDSTSVTNKTGSIAGWSNLSEPALNQVVCPPLYVSSESDVGIKVSLKAAGKKTGGSVALVETAEGITNEAPQAFLFIRMVAAQDNSTVPDGLMSDGSDYAAETDLAVTATAGDPKEMYTLPAVATGETAYAAFAVNGKLSDNPPKKKLWTNQDAINVTLTFSFDVVANSGETV